MGKSGLWGALGLIACAACGGSDDADWLSHASNREPAAPPASGDAIVSVRIDPPKSAATVDLGDAPLVLRLRAYAMHASGIEEDVTKRATWSIDRAAMGAFAPADSALTLVGIGGHATLAAAVDGVKTSAPLIVKLTGSVFSDHADPKSSDAFDAAPIADGLPDVLEYPTNDIIAPANVAPFEMQWAAPSNGTLHRVHITCDDVLDLKLYTTRTELPVPIDVWTKIGRSAPDAPLSIVADSMDATAHRHPSQEVSLTLTAETLAQTKVFTHKTGGGIHAIDIEQGAELPLTTNGAQSTSCGGCHVVSKTGRRMSYALNSANLSMGVARFDDQARIFSETISPSRLVYSPSATFNPAEVATRPSMLATVAPTAPAVTSTLALFDPDTGAALPSDVDTMLATVPATVGRGATMPAWSLAGDLVVFAGYDHDDPADGRPGVNVLSSSIVEASVSFNAGKFHFGAPRVLVQGSLAENDLRPSLSTDNVAVAFTRTTAGGAAPGTTAVIVRRSDGHVFTIGAGLGGGGAWDTRSPDWGPATSKYAWIAVTSSRAYGHELAAGAIHQLWVFAVDRAKLAAGVVDPSSAPFRISGQALNANYIHPQWPVSAPAAME